MPLPNRTYSSPSYRYGYNGKEKDDEVKGNGNSLNFDARIFDPRIGKWFKLDEKAAKYPSWSPYHFGYDNPIVTVDIDGNENIVVAGGQHDESAGNKMMFIHQAIRQLRAYETNESNETRTLIYFTEGYTQQQQQAIEKAALKYGANVVMINSSLELTNYINSNSPETGELSPSRINDPVTSVDIFAHGVVGSIEFGYEQQNADAARFTASSSLQLNKDAFAENAVFNSYACRTGLGVDIKYFAHPGQKLDLDKSLAQSIANNLKIKVNAYATRTDYVNTLSSSGDRMYLKLMAYGLMPLPGNPTSSGMNIMEWKRRLASRETIDKATFDPQGAVHPVQGGDSPYNIPNEMIEYNCEQ